MSDSVELRVQELEKLGFRLRQMQIYASPVMLEPPLQIMGTVFSCEVGGYSAINTACIGGLGPPVKIGRYCMAAYGCHIGVGRHPRDWLSHHYFQYRDHFFPFPPDHPEREQFVEAPQTIVGNDVWIGENAVIAAGVTIGDGAHIGAGASVTEDVPPYAVIEGASARMTGLRFPEALVARLLKVRWWEFEHVALCRLPFKDVARSLDLLEAAEQAGTAKRIAVRHWPVA